ncbi:hypothetical protein [Roseibium sp. MMSF_3412]|nr:hypothetical protein [Roseibium sp. MMSF_3412]
MPAGISNRYFGAGIAADLYGAVLEPADLQSVSKVGIEKGGYV